MLGQPHCEDIPLPTGPARPIFIFYPSKRRDKPVSFTEAEEARTHQWGGRFRIFRWDGNSAYPSVRRAKPVSFRKAVEAHILQWGWKSASQSVSISVAVAAVSFNEEGKAWIHQWGSRSPYPSVKLKMLSSFREMNYGFILSPLQCRPVAVYSQPLTVQTCCGLFSAPYSTDLLRFILSPLQCRSAAVYSQHLTVQTCCGLFSAPYSAGAGFSKRL